MRYTGVLVLMVLGLAACALAPIPGNELGDADMVQSENVNNEPDSTTDSALDTPTDIPTDCKPNCDGKKCGPDGCGGTCGQCQTGYTCDAGKCVYNCFDTLFGGPADSQATDVTIDLLGNIIAVGYLSGQNSRDLRVVKINTNGLELWNKTFGGDELDEGRGVSMDTDGNIVVTGYTRSKGAGDADMWMIKLDPDGKLLWDKTFGGTSRDYGNSVLVDRNGDYVVAGSTASKGTGFADVWVVKLDKTGKKIWDKTFGGENEDKAFGIIQDGQGNYVLAGVYGSPTGHTKLWVIKLSAAGDQIWEKKFDEGDAQEATAISPDSKGNYLVAGFIMEKGASAYNPYIIRLDNNGNKLWTKIVKDVYKYNRQTKARSIAGDGPGGFVITVYPDMKVGESPVKTQLMKFDLSGNMLWQADVGYMGGAGTKADAIMPYQDLTYIIAGGGGGFWVSKLDSKGHTVCQ